MRQMNNSGIEWIGSIPKNWEIDRIKSRVGKHFSGCWGGACNAAESGENCRLCIRVADFDFNTQTIKNTADTFRMYSKQQIATNKLEDGDILVEKSGGGEKTPVGRTVLFRASNYDNQEVLFANFCECFRLQNVYPEFFAYMLKSFYYTNDMCMFFNQTTGLQNLDMQAILNANVAFPPLDEQMAIAEFLDRECGKIDPIIADAQAQIDTLEEYKKSVITEAVTKGLNHNAEMKDTGAKWIKHIPQTWSVEKAKYCFPTRNTKGNAKNLELLSPTQKFGVIPQKMYEELSTQVTVKVSDNTNLMAFKTICKGDYCISLRSFEGGFEYCEYEGVVSPAYTVFYPVIATDRRYYKYLFKIQPFIYEMNSYSLSLRDGKPISFVDFGNTLIPVPPLEEQQQIANYLDGKCCQIDAVIDEKKSQLETLEQYKKSLIYEYVTGKKEVV